MGDRYDALFDPAHAVRFAQPAMTARAQLDQRTIAGTVTDGIGNVCTLFSTAQRGTVAQFTILLAMDTQRSNPSRTRLRPMTAGTQKTSTTEDKTWIVELS
jgi:hypothetical protein